MEGGGGAGPFDRIRFGERREASVVQVRITDDEKSRGRPESD